MGFSFTLPPRTNYSLSCRSGYFRLLAETQHNGLIHRVTCRVFGDALLLGPFPCRLRWREAVAHSQPWFQTPAMKASSSSSSSGRSEGPLAGSRAADDWLFLSAESAAPQHLHTAADEHEVEDKGKLKSKLVSAWNSVKYGLLTVLYFFPPVLIKPNRTFHLFWHMELVCPLFMFQAGPSNQSPNLARALQWLCSESPMSSGNQVSHLDSL